MSYIEEVLWMSKSGYSDIELLEYIDKHFDEIECEFNGEEYKEPKHNRYFCMNCKLRKIVDYERSTFTHDINGSGYDMYTADNICKMIEFLIDNIFVQFGGCLFRQVIGIPMGTNCAPLLADLFLYSYENEFLDNMIRSGHRRLARSFNLCYRYIDDLIVFNNKKFLDYLKEIYPSQLTVEKANKSDHLADYLLGTFKAWRFFQRY